MVEEDDASYNWSAPHITIIMAGLLSLLLMHHCYDGHDDDMMNGDIIFVNNNVC